MVTPFSMAPEAPPGPVTTRESMEAQAERLLEKLPAFVQGFGKFGPLEQNQKDGHLLLKADVKALLAKKLSDHEGIFWTLRSSTDYWEQEYRYVRQRFIRSERLLTLFVSLTAGLGILCAIAIARLYSLGAL